MLRVASNQCIRVKFILLHYWGHPLRYYYYYYYHHHHHHHHHRRRHHHVRHYHHINISTDGDDCDCGYYDCCCLPSFVSRQQVILQVVAESSHTTVCCLQYCSLSSCQTRRPLCAVLQVHWRPMDPGLYRSVRWLHEIILKYSALMLSRKVTNKYFWSFVLLLDTSFI
jgi:hypothetical protein